MLDPDLAFRIGGLLAMAGWAALLASLAFASLRRPALIAARMAIPALLAIAYVLLIAQGIGTEGGGFGSIPEVRALFADDSALAAGWLHYLAFDLFVGAWIVSDGTDRGVHPLLLIPCMALTFLLGPSGLLLYLLIRLAFFRSRPEPETQP